MIRNIEWQPDRGSSNISTVMISPDASLLLSQDKQRYGDLHRLWNLKTGELIRTFDTYPYWVANAIANTSDGRIFHLEIGLKRAFTRPPGQRKDFQFIKHSRIAPVDHMTYIMGTENFSKV